MKRALVVALVLMGIIVVMLWTWQRRLIYFPTPGPVPAADEVLAGARDAKLKTIDDLELGAWFVPARGPSRNMTVLIANGNGGDRSLRTPLAEALANKGFSVMLFDYRGYGGNPGSPSEEGLALDVRAAHRWLLESEGVPADRIIYFGESLGAAVVTELATEFPPAGLVLRSPFTDLAAVGREHYPLLPVGLLLRDRFPVVELLRELRVPTTVVYSSRDSIVPPEQSRTVARAAASLVRTVEIQATDHNDPLLLNGPQLIDAIVDLAQTAGGPS